jgi:hypothetical protein
MKSGEGIGHLFAVISVTAWGTSFKDKTRRCLKTAK